MTRAYNSNWYKPKPINNKTLTTDWIIQQRCIVLRFHHSHGTAQLKLYSHHVRLSSALIFVKVPPPSTNPHWPGRHLQRSGQDGGRAGQRRAKLSALLSRQRFPASATGRGKEKEKTNSEQLGRSADTVNTCGPNMWWEQRFCWTMTNSFCDRVCVCGHVCSRPVGLQLCIRLPCSILGHRPFMKVIC